MHQVACNRQEREKNVTEPTTEGSGLPVDLVNSECEQSPKGAE
jgi:hypothetical protein